MKKVTKCNKCFSSIGVPTRMIIYTHLTVEGEKTVSEIVKHVKLTQPTISHHLKEMKMEGLLKGRRDGKQVLYSVNESCPHTKAACVLHGLEFPDA